jgi:diguanylate cyclase (GGDEF)-like protein
MGGQLSGLLVLGDREDNGLYSAEDMRLMNILAGQLAIAIRNAELYTKTATDGLTRLYNRAYFDIRLEKAIKNARQEKTPLSVIIMDVDGFMPFSFENGRMAAEQALIDIAQELTKTLTRYKVIARFGEDEFSVILPDTDEESALFVTRNVKRTIDGLAIQGKNSKRKLTVCAGVATMKDDSDTCHKLTGRALTALQESKTVIESGEGSV